MVCSICRKLLKKFSLIFRLISSWHTFRVWTALLHCHSSIISGSDSLHCLQLCLCKFYSCLVLCVLDFQSTFQHYRCCRRRRRHCHHQTNGFNAVSSYQTHNCNHRGNFWEKPEIRLAASIKIKTMLSVNKIYCFLVHVDKQSAKLESAAVVAVRNDKSRLKLPMEWIITW